MGSQPHAHTGPLLTLHEVIWQTHGTACSSELVSFTAYPSPACACSCLQAATRCADAWDPAQGACLQVPPQPLPGAVKTESTSGIAACAGMHRPLLHSLQACTGARHLQELLSWPLRPASPDNCMSTRVWTCIRHFRLCTLLLQQPALCSPAGDHPRHTLIA